MGKILFRLVCFTNFALIILFCACRKEPSELLYNQTVEYMKELAGKENRPFCIVLSDPNCPPCVSYVKILENQYGHLKEEAIFNIVNTSLPENQWYQQWICSMAMPA